MAVDPRKTWLLLGGLLLVAVLIGLALLGVLLDLLRPEPGPALPEARRRSARVVQTAAPGDEPAASPALDCPVEVLVLDEGGAPVAGAKVALAVSPPGAAPGAPPVDPRAGDALRTDANGAVTVPAACGVGRLTVRADGLAPHRRDRIDTLSDRSLRVVLRLGVRVEGAVLDASTEAPIAGARVASGATSTETDRDGRYLLRVDPEQVRAIEATAEGYGRQSERLWVEVGSTSAVELDLWLQPSRTVEVLCLGQPDDLCDRIEPILCTSPLFPMGEPCETGPEGTSCACPMGEAAVRGGGAAVRVGPEDDLVALDLRFSGGGLRGVTLVAGQPSSCVLRAVRLPVGLEDIPLGLAAGQVLTSDIAGAFTFANLKPGRYQLQALCGGPTRMIDAGVVDDAMRDLGHLFIDEGAQVSGAVIDGVTGEGAVGQVVVAVGTDGVGGATAMSGPEGAFTLTGLEAGDYEILLATRPLSSVQLTLGADAKVDGVELRTGSASLLSENDVKLATDDEGKLVVSAENADLGLRPGDEVVSLEIGGVDLRDVLPGYTAEAVDAVLEHYSGPGVQLILDDGEAERAVGLR
jgi:hypothetical protein